MVNCLPHRACQRGLVGEASHLFNTQVTRSGWIPWYLSFPITSVVFPTDSPAVLAGNPWGKGGPLLAGGAGHAVAGTACSWKGSLASLDGGVKLGAGLKAIRNLLLTSLNSALVLAALHGTTWKVCRKHCVLPSFWKLHGANLTLTPYKTVISSYRPGTYFASTLGIVCRKHRVLPVFFMKNNFFFPTKDLIWVKTI